MECDTDEERLELWQAIMEYGLFWKEPPKKFKRDFVNIRFILKRSREISEKRSNAWKQWGAPKGNKNAVKKKEKQTKQAKTTKTNESDSHSHSISNSNECIVNKYLDYVYLKNNEYMNLIEWYGEKAITDYIERLNNWIWEKPNSKDRKNRNHYFTIQSWLRKDWVKKLPEKPKDDSWVYENLRDQDVYLQELIKWKQK